MKTRYAFKGYDIEKMARAIGKDLSVTTKQSVELCNFLRNKPLSRVKEMLEKVANKELAVPYKRYKKDIAHRRGIGIGRYPVKASREILKIIKSAEANANVKGLPVDKLYVIHLLAQRASRPMRTGRKRGMVAKRTHIEVVLHEFEPMNVKDKNKANKTKQVEERNESKKTKVGDSMKNVKGESAMTADKKQKANKATPQKLRDETENRTHDKHNKENNKVEDVQ